LTESQQTDRVQSPRRTEKLATLLLFCFAGILIIVVAIIFLNQPNNSNHLKDVNQDNSLLANIPQNGQQIGKSQAPITLIEFADPRCSSCAIFSKNTFPDIVNQLVAEGQLQVQYQPWVILDDQNDDQSRLAAQAALAAGEQNHLFNFIKVFYSNQQPEYENYVDQKYLTKIAKAAQVPDIKLWRKDIKKNADDYNNLIDYNYQLAGRKLRLPGTPSFVFQGSTSLNLYPTDLGFTSDVQDFVQKVNELGLKLNI
jgi:protein-disulfide isomerase